MTLTRADVAAALGRNDVFDFLVDIVPRDAAAATTSSRPQAAVATSAASATASATT